MNVEELQAMSNEQLNELAAVQVMGWNTKHLFGWGIVVTDPLNPENSKHKWNPTGDMNDTMTLVRKLKDTHWFELRVGSDKESAAFDLYKSWRNNDSLALSEPRYYAQCDNAERAITIAAILAKASE